MLSVHGGSAGSSGGGGARTIWNVPGYLVTREREPTKQCTGSQGPPLEVTQVTSAHVLLAKASRLVPRTYHMLEGSWKHWGRT